MVTYKHLYTGQTSKPCGLKMLSFFVQEKLKIIFLVGEKCRIVVSTIRNRKGGGNEGSRK